VEGTLSEIYKWEGREKRAEWWRRKEGRREERCSTE
jgi:hypothetical protein